MSLIKCKTCAHEVSDNAKFCPNCGEIEIIEIQHSHIGMIFQYILISITFISIVAFFLVVLVGIPIIIHEFYKLNMLMNH